jgi:hypothetical protein
MVTPFPVHPGADGHKALLRQQMWLKPRWGTPARIRVAANLGIFPMMFGVLNEVVLVMVCLLRVETARGPGSSREHYNMVDSGANADRDREPRSDDLPERSNGDPLPTNETPSESMNRIESNAHLFERIDSLYRERSGRWWSFLRRLCGWR